jgi:hypothetical protein
LVAVGVYRVNRNAVRVDQVSLWIDGAIGDLSRGLQSDAVLDRGHHTTVFRGSKLALRGC